ncbi:MAG: tRNA lysidine(34) synthetase TilS [Brevinema sp.]
MIEYQDNFFHHLSEFFDQYSLSYPNIAVAVSGGSDSIFLMHTCARISQNIVVLHVNHQTRPECQKEATFIQDQCQQLGLSFVELKAENLFLAMPNFEDQARRERYRLFLEYGNQFQLTHILTAHHQNDVVETVLLKLFRASPSMFIPSFRLLDNQYKIQLFRPMLGLSQLFIKSYLLEQGLLFITDSSNNDTKYLRNYLRIDILPLLKNKIASFDQKIISFAQQRQEESDFLMEYIKQREQALFSGLSSDVNEFLREHPIIQQGILRNKIRTFTYKEISRKQLRDMITKIRESHSGILFQDDKIELIKEHEKIKFISKNEKENLEKNVLIIHNKKIYSEFSDWKICFGDGLRFDRETDTIYLRSVASDDRIAWNIGSKKVSRLLADKKTPKSEQAYVIIKNSEIVGLLSTKITYIIPQQRDKNHGLLIKSTKGREYEKNRSIIF